LLDLYNLGDQQQTQFARAYDVARDRLADMQGQRDALDDAITDLKTQMKWGEKMLASMNQSKKAAE
jgi:hypothetical protein